MPSILDNRHSIPSSLLRPIPESQVMTNGCIKINPRTGEPVLGVFATRDIFKALAVESVDPADRAVPRRDGSGLVRAARRAKAQLYELADANDFDLFFTLTLAPERIDRYDYKAAVKKFGEWVDNRVRRRGLRYIAVPELHKDGAIHFHGLCNSDACKLVDAHRRDEAGRMIYNLADWSLGFTTAVRLDGNREAVAHYLSKYVLKQVGGLGARPQVGNGGEVTYRGTIGGRYYFHGGPLVRYTVQHFRLRSWDDIPGEGVPVEGCDGLRLKYVTDFTLLSELAESGRLERVRDGGNTAEALRQQRPERPEPGGGGYAHADRETDAKGGLALGPAPAEGPESNPSCRPFAGETREGRGTSFQPLTHPCRPVLPGLRPNTEQ